MRRKALPPLLLACCLLSACGGPAPTGADPGLQDMFPNAGEIAHQPGGGITRFVLHNVLYREDADMQAFMPMVDADAIESQPGMPFVPGNIHDYVIKIHTGEILKDEASLSHLFNAYVFNYDGCPISNVQIKMVPGRITMSGSMQEGPLTVPFSMAGTLRPDGNGHIVMHADSITAVGGLPISGGLMGLTGAPAVINAHPEHGVTMSGNDITLDLTKMMPPPQIQGFVSAVQVLDGKIDITFDDGVHRPLPPLPQPGARNWILMWGGDVLINTTLMKDAKLQLVDMTPQDPLGFYLPAYIQQLAAGFVVANTDGSMVAYVPDCDGTTVTEPPFQPTPDMMR